MKKAKGKYEQMSKIENKIVFSLRNFWIRLRGYNNCALHKATQTAILKYSGAPDVLPPEPTTWEEAIRDGFVSTRVIHSITMKIRIVDIVHKCN